MLSTCLEEYLQNNPPAQQLYSDLSKIGNLYLIVAPLIVLSLGYCSEHSHLVCYSDSGFTVIRPKVNQLNYPNQFRPMFLDAFGSGFVVDIMFLGCRSS